MGRLRMKCLVCDKYFLADGIENRVCAKCKADPAFSGLREWFFDSSEKERKQGDQ